MHSPKQLFLASAYRKPHEEWAMTQAAAWSVTMALAQMEAEQPEVLSDPSKSWDYGAQMIGARRLADILLTLHMPPTERKVVPFPNLPPPR